MCAMKLPEDDSIPKRKIAKDSIIWLIENFSFCWGRLGREIASSKFQAHGSWHLAFRTGADSNDDDRECQFLSFFLHHEDSQNVTAEATFCVVDVKNNDALKSTPTVLTFTDGIATSGFLGTITRSALQSEAAQLMPGDSLTIRCDLTLIDYSDEHTERHRTTLSVTDCRLSEDLGWLLDSGSGADVTVNVGDGRYRAHKAILASRSPVFRAMFQHDMLENLQGQVFVTDIEYEVFGEMLRFIYTGRSPNLDNMAHALMVAADKYGLLTLRDECEDALIENLSFESAAFSLIVGDKLNATILRHYSLNFICANLCEVMKTDGWCTLVDDHIDLVLDVIIAALPESCEDTIEPHAKRRRLYERR
ncbi:hypothetical protein V5799_017899 [Amblyomma americanum]|uniref:BTB domain-containing protein n=1 Tax=Amblyomma americanum TaxID=6943 RepID=A0AAQ4F0T4_AMBAM